MSKDTSKRNPIVWVLQENNYDFTPAEKFGDVKFITSANLRHIAHSSQNQQIESDMERFLVEYDNEIDYLVMTGDPVMIYKLAYTLGKLDQVVGEAPSSRTHRLLKWDNRRAEYIAFGFNEQQVI